MIKPKPILRHANEITEYDLEWFGFYMELFDLKKAGKSWVEIADIVWPQGKPPDYKKHLKENYTRAKWMTETGYKLMMEANPRSRSESFDMLVETGQMKPEERAFLESPIGEKFWPKNTKH